MADLDLEPLGAAETLRWLRRIDERLNGFVTLDRLTIEMQLMEDRMMGASRRIESVEGRVQQMWDWMTSIRGASFVAKWGIPVLAILQIFQFFRH